MPVSKKRKPKKGRSPNGNRGPRDLITIPFWEFESAAKHAASLDPDPKMTTEVFIQAMLNGAIRVAPLTPDGRGYKTTSFPEWAEKDGLPLDSLMETLFRAYEIGALAWHDDSMTYEMKDPFSLAT